MAAKRGAFIVVEGCDRAGKTTQCKRLGNILQIPLKHLFSYQINLIKEFSIKKIEFSKCERIIRHNCPSILYM